MERARKLTLVHRTQMGKTEIEIKELETEPVERNQFHETTKLYCRILLLLAMLVTQDKFARACVTLR